MKVFKVEILFDENEGFNAEVFKKFVIGNLAEIGMKLYGFDYHKNSQDICAEFPNLNRKVSDCNLFIEVADYISPMIPDHKIVLGSISTIPNKYPELKIYSITPSFVEINE